MVSQVHVLVVVPYAFWSILHDSPERLLNPAFGWEEKAGYVHAIACGCVSRLKWIILYGSVERRLDISCGMREML